MTSLATYRSDLALSSVVAAAGGDAGREPVGPAELDAVGADVLDTFSVKTRRSLGLLQLILDHKEIDRAPHGSLAAHLVDVLPLLIEQLEELDEQIWELGVLLGRAVRTLEAAELAAARAKALSALQAAAAAPFIAAPPALGGRRAQGAI